jgi:PIN domain nuclease of toxin-antitoxin system
MGNRAITIDTHALLWYFDMGQNKKFSMLALQAIADAEHDGIIYVPAKERTDTIIL